MLKKPDSPWWGIGCKLRSVATVVSCRWRLRLRFGCSTTRTVRLPIARTTVRTTAVTTSATTPICVRACSGLCSFARLSKLWQGIKFRRPAGQSATALFKYGNKNHICLYLPSTSKAGVYNLSPRTKEFAFVAKQITQGMHGPVVLFCIVTNVQSIQI